VIIKTETVDTFVWLLNRLRLFAVDVDVSETHYADADFNNVVIASVWTESISVWKRDQHGEPMRNSHRVIPIENINNITIL
jgi:hypothetical protein